MSARAPRRRFANPFVLTLAAIPAACTVQSAPPPQGPTQHASNTHDHRDEPKHVNPPRSRPQPQPQPDPTPVANPPRPAPPAHTGTNDHVKDTASTTSTTVAQTAPEPEKGRGYRQWTISRTGSTCQSMVKTHCPEGAMCNPPPPAKYECPKSLADNGRMEIIQHSAKSECFVDFGPMECPPNTKCNPPRPQKVACPK